MLSHKESPGVYRKYLVKRLGDKLGKHRLCEYFVLDWSHDKFAIPAALAYADACEAEYPELAYDLRGKAAQYRKTYTPPSPAPAPPEGKR